MALATKGAYKTVHNHPDIIASIVVYVLQRTGGGLKAMETESADNCLGSTWKSDHSPNSSSNREESGRCPFKKILK